jgi:aminopeptidase YwaD
MKMMMLLLFLSASSFAQDLPYAREMVNTLASKEYWGRGYTKDGMKKAADFIVNQVTREGVVPLDGKDFRQNFTMPVNTFPGAMSVSINGIKLTPGLQYIVSPGAKGLKASGKLVQTDATHFTDSSHGISFTISDKLTWSVAMKVASNTSIELDKSKLPAVPETYEVDIENAFVPAFQASNIAAMVKGTEHPDQYVVMSAHYDHLGGMGTEAYFPGANDNASGTSTLLDLVKYYSTHPQPYSVVFLFFAAEEAGLVGSHYFVDHPLIDLKKIRFLMNLDLMGNGDLGATIVNATIFPSEFDALQKVNADQGNLLNKIYPRGKAANSDHYWFSEKGVPAFFIYTMGGPPWYHDVMDLPENLLFSKYDSVYKLLLGFNQAIMDLSETATVK